jgi:PDZ domain
MHGGAADRSGLIHVGDEVIEVNNINVEGKTPNDVLTILVSRLANFIEKVSYLHSLYYPAKFRRCHNI